MQLYSTKDHSHVVSLKEAIFKGLPPDNGLYMPVSIPKLSPDFFAGLDKKSFTEISYEVSKTLIGDDIPEQDLRKILDEVITFDAPVIKLKGNIHALELFHGPSFAFKDFGARFMAKVMSYFLEREHKEINILVATSGDTGSAVAQGFYNMPGIKVTILYPSKKVSDIQERQLTTLGNNITALEIAGTFDDCQAMVKQAFLDPDLNARLNLSSANSINISRLIPQTFYYFYAYAQLLHTGRNIVFSVPSGNFGNLTAGLIAKRMGLPVEKFIAATNANDIVPSFLLSGIFSPRPSVSTISNAMDVGNPSNFFRLSELYGNDLKKIREDVKGATYSDVETNIIMREVHEQTGYVLDPHGAIGYLGLKDYFRLTDSKANGVFLGTAHPGKFQEVVEHAIQKKVDLPERLKMIINRPKMSVPTPNDFNAFKQFLLN